MPDVEIAVIGIGTAAAFVAGGVYYGVLGERLARVGGAPAGAEAAGWTYLAELLRCLVLAAVVAGLAAAARVEAVDGGLALGAALWVGFPLVLWVGAVVHERTPIALAAIHAGDWLIKLLLVGLLVGLLA